jgi:hypothetical protein
VSSSTTRELADRALEIQAASDGLAKTAARCVAVMCADSPSVEVARSMLEGLTTPDLRKASIELLDRLAAEAGART